MTAALHWLAPGSLVGLAPGSRMTLDGAEGHHAVRVKRLSVGEEVWLADGSGMVAVCRSVSVNTAEASAELEVLELRLQRHEGPRFVLVQALAKGERDELAVETATELGVDEVVPWQAQRSIVVWRGARGEKAQRKWGSIAVAAAKQSRRATAPDIAPVADLAGLCIRAASAALVIVAHETATTGLHEVELPDTGDVLLVVGPEGGITSDELSELRAAGAKVVRLGVEVLRASTAGPAMLAALSARARWRACADQPPMPTLNA